MGTGRDIDGSRRGRRHVRPATQTASAHSRRSPRPKPLTSHVVVVVSFKETRLWIPAEVPSRNFDQPSGALANKLGRCSRSRDMPNVTPVAAESSKIPHNLNS